jgi:hypothetical protein
MMSCDLASPIQPGLFDTQPDPDVCGRRSRQNPQSREAYRAILPTKAELRHSIWTFLAQNGPRTCEEIAEEMHLRYTTASARLSELKRDGLAVPTGERRPTLTGSLAAVIKAARPHEHGSAI